MKNTTIAKLEAFFAGLDRDLEIGLASALADKCRCSAAEIFSVYEAWQIK
jgi:flagellar biosynthesis GTPase FlhF